MDILEAFEAHARADGSTIVHRWRNRSLTRAQLSERSNALAGHLCDLGLERGEPILVYGHKQPEMLVAFLGCVKAGHPYIPVDSSLPPARVEAIVESSAARHIVAIEEIELPGMTITTAGELAVLPSRPLQTDPVGLDEPFYIIYTSGSTGTPKGVQITRRAINNFVSWALTLVDGGTDRQVYLNQAPFSFDLSVYELAMALASNGAIHSIDKDHIGRFRDLFDDLAASNATVWVSTPSFADLCLAAPSFSSELLPHLRTFLFCGEALSNATSAELLRRFPDATVVNTYGPTESTVAVTSIVCDQTLLERFPVLPVGRVKPGTTIQVWSPDGSPVAEGDTGEIVIAGDTVSLGYYRRPDLTAAAFTTLSTGGEKLPAYRTGDAGYFADGVLHFVGRLDFQVKLHGYRIEIEDIESNLRKLPSVQHAVVMPVPKDGGAVSHLLAAVQLVDGRPESPFRRTAELKKALREVVPDYMVPKAFVYVNQIPLTANGKVDRTALKASL